MIFGLDVSTSYVGWCLLGEDATVIDIGHIDLHLCKNFYHKCDKIQNFIHEYFVRRKGDVKQIWVEEPVKMYQSNASMAQTITKLQRFNAVCCWILRSYFDIEPQFIMATSARKKAGIKIPKGTKGKETKKYILQYVQSLKVIPEEKWNYKKTGTPKDWCFDQADAYVVAVSGLNSEQ